MMDVHPSAQKLQDEDAVQAEGGEDLPGGLGGVQLHSQWKEGSHHS